MTLSEFVLRYTLFNWIRHKPNTLLLSNLIMPLRSYTLNVGDLGNTYLANYNTPKMKEEIKRIKGLLPGTRSQKYYEGFSDEKRLLYTAFDTASVKTKYDEGHALYGITWESRRAEDTLTRGIGVCSDKAILLVGLLRGLGIPARVVGGDLYKTQGKYGPITVAHSWVEAFIDGEWVTLDPTGNVSIAAFFKESNMEKIKNTYKKSEVSDLNSDDPFSIEKKNLYI